MDIGGRYQLEGELGSGGFGRVWRARDNRLGVPVAIKELRLPAALPETDRAERLTRAAREARNAARLRDHPDVLTVYDVVIENDVPWIVMRLAEGGSLADRIARGGPLPVDEVAGIAQALLRALGAAHEAGIVHRDVKPANVLLTGEGRALLTDFGIAVHREDTTLTVTGALLGSMEYVAPERARGTTAPGGDLFSLGVTLYEAVEGVSPFRRDTATETLTAVLFDPPPAPRRAGRLASLITGLLEKDPADRPTVADALAELAGQERTLRKTIRVPSAPNAPGQRQRQRAVDRPGRREREPGDGPLPWQGWASLVTLLLMCWPARTGVVEGPGPIESALRRLPDDVLPPVTILLVLSAVAAGVATATVLVRFGHFGLRRLTGTIGTTIAGLLHTVTAVLGFLLPTAAYMGTVHLLEEAISVSAAIWIALGVITVGQILAVGWQREALPGTAKN
ncbi:serine/threonine-protein kinase [Streptomyces xiamenensis]|uniref:serine/threonine-protein kinase n=1 Tax=Streptomyces xiamenensis TaxID=408015 RepID=UPI0036E08A15